MLVLLDLSFNIIIKLNEDSFAGLHNLRFLDLNSNLRQRYRSSLMLPRNVFKHLVNLTLLDLSYNNIRSIHQYAFNGLVELQHLKFNSNELGKIPNGTFQYTPNLVILELVYNSIYNVTKGMFTGLGNLHQLYLKGNYMRSIQNNAFQSLINLIELNLSFNLLHSVNRLMFAGLPKLRHLYLGFNNINKISNQTFENLTDLRLLDLANNMLQSLNEKTFTGLKNLQVLRLNNNNLRYTTEWLPPGCFKALESLRHLSIQMNNPRNEIDTFILPDETIKDLKMLENLTLDANANDERILDEDRAFVLNDCIENLENDGNLKLCVHHRDFVPGEDISDNIIHAIESSRKTVFGTIDMLELPPEVQQHFDNGEFTIRQVSGRYKGIWKIWPWKKL
ncbi:leucine-rich repeat-containing protein 15-like [Mytilus trossulus]|uniref:leucine-rich repeat-containing protein 15-like n=1 Tax=Mytilus trossulus TaxID=6551 RepID=UPI0030047CE4